MSQQIGIPRDVLVNEILSKLPFRSLIRFLDTNKELATELLPYIQERIELEELKDAEQAYHERLEERYQQGVDLRKEFGQHLAIAPTLMIRVISLDDQLTKFMNVEHMPKNNGRTIYSSYLLESWFINYLYFNYHRKYDLNDIVPLTSDMKKLLGRRIAPMTLRDYINKIVRLHFQSIPNMNYSNIPEEWLLALEEEESNLEQDLLLLQRHYRRNDQ